MSQLEIATRTDAGEAPSRAGWILALGSVAAFAVFLDTTIVNVAFETISRSFGTTAGHLSWVLNSYSLVFAAVLIPSGRLADSGGRARPDPGRAAHRVRVLAVDLPHQRADLRGHDRGRDPAAA